MEALLETTQWNSPTPNHCYLVDGHNIVAYIKQFHGVPEWFKNPIGFDKRGRTFKKVGLHVFGLAEKTEPIHTYEVKGSTGATYIVTKRKNAYYCSCTGFQFRGQCKHVEQIAAMAA